jgi:hypothetical protein
MTRTFYVGLDLLQAQSIMEDIIIKDSITGKLVDKYDVITKGDTVIISVFEKFFVKASNEASLTTIIDTYNNFTRIHVIGAAGGSWILNQDFGAEKGFEDYISEKMDIYKIKDEDIK